MGCAASKDTGDPWALCQAGALGLLVQWLDTPGNDVNAVDPAKGRGSLLHAAAAAGQEECVELLLKSGADVGLSVEGLGTALHAAAANGAGNAVTLLLANGASPEAEHQGRTAAEVAQLKGFSATANLIRMMAQKPPAPRDADDKLANDSAGSGGSSRSSMRNGSGGSGVLSDPLLEVVRRAMLSGPPAGESPAQPISSPDGADGATRAAPQHAQLASSAQQGQKGCESAQPGADQQSRNSSGGGSSAAIGRRSAGRLTIDVRFYDFDELEMPPDKATLGSGSYGRVYKAKLHETPVAVKVLLDLEEAQAAEPGAVWSLSNPILFNLKKESSLMASLQHPNIVQFMGVCTRPPAMITEYCSRGSLAEVLKGAKGSPAKLRALTWLRRLGMALDAAKGMLYLHESGVVHRDLKSPNLLVDKYWKTKVADFNLSKILDTDTGSGRSALANMNPRWLAPEILNGEAATRASDVFSWGVVMWEILTLELPWPHVKTWAVVGKLLEGARLEVPLRDQIPGCDTPTFQGLDTYVALMQRCWAQRPEERPGFKEIVVQIRALLDAHTKAAAQASGGGASAGAAPLLSEDSGGALSPSPLAGSSNRSRAGAS